MTGAGGRAWRAHWEPCWRERKRLLKLPEGRASKWKQEIFCPRTSPTFCPIERALPKDSVCPPEGKEGCTGIFFKSATRNTIQDAEPPNSTHTLCDCNLTVLFKSKFLALLLLQPQLEKKNPCTYQKLKGGGSISGRLSGCVFRRSPQKRQTLQEKTTHPKLLHFELLFWAEKAKNRAYGPLLPGLWVGEGTASLARQQRPLLGCGGGGGWQPVLQASEWPAETSENYFWFPSENQEAAFSKPEVVFRGFCRPLRGL